MTQAETILDYIKTHGSILPAKVGGTIYKGVMLGSESSKRCREMRKKGILTSHKEGKFEVFTLAHLAQSTIFRSIENESKKMREVRYENARVQSLF